MVMLGKNADGRRVGAVSNTLQWSVVYAIFPADSTLLWHHPATKSNSNSIPKQKSSCTKAKETEVTAGTRFRHTPHLHRSILRARKMRNNSILTLLKCEGKLIASVISEKPCYIQLNKVSCICKEIILCSFYLLQCKTWPNLLADNSSVIRKEMSQIRCASYCHNLHHVLDAPSNAKK